MKIAILSGKGGTGKTFISVNLAVTAPKSVYIDCDVEEPNGKLFLKTSGIRQHRVYVKVPEFNRELCNGCRKCVDFCHFNALMFLRDRPRLFQEICHSCGGCRLVCERGAITEKEREVGLVEESMFYDTAVITGILNLGEASGVPVIREALKTGSETDSEYKIIDCPPGSACTVSECVSDADYCILVVEPTAFGYENFLMVHELVSLLHKPFGVVINKKNTDYPKLSDFLRQNRITPLLEIPYDRELNGFCSKGLIASCESSFWKNQFSNLLTKVKEEVHEKVISS